MTCPSKNDRVEVIKATMLPICKAFAGMRGVVVAVDEDRNAATVKFDGGAAEELPCPCLTRI